MSSSVTYCFSVVFPSIVTPACLKSSSSTFLLLVLIFYRWASSGTKLYRWASSGTKLYRWASSGTKLYRWASSGSLLNFKVAVKDVNLC